MPRKARTGSKAIPQVRNFKFVEGQRLYKDLNGYYRTTRDKLLHYVKFFHAYGPVPEGWGIFHINRDKLDNNPDNLVALPFDFMTEINEEISEKKRTLNRNEILDRLSLVLRGDEKKAKERDEVEKKYDEFMEKHKDIVGEYFRLSKLRKELRTAAGQEVVIAGEYINPTRFIERMRKTTFKPASLAEQFSGEAAALL